MVRRGVIRGWVVRREGVWLKGYRRCVITKGGGVIR